MTNHVETSFSEDLYDRLLNLYPRAFQQQFGEEMRFVFSEVLREAEAASGVWGVAVVWRRTLADALVSIITQHLNDQEGHATMKNHLADLVMENKVFGWIALATGLLLLIPLVAMQFNSGVNWSTGDFVVMGALLFITGSIFVLTARRVDRAHWGLVAFVVAAGFLYLWAELAVGVFLTWGS